MDEAVLEASAVDDPYSTVKADVELLLSSPLLPEGMGVSGHVYDVETGRVTTVVDTRCL
jgi:carbonic anhydrase